MHIKLIQPLTLILIALATASPALALAAEPEGIRSGSAIYYPYAGVTVGHDDNVLSQENNSISSTVTFANAGVQAQVLQDNQKGAFEFGLAAQTASYQDSKADDYDDGSVNIGYVFQPNDKMRVSGALSLDQLHDPRRPATLATSTEPDVYEDSNFEAEFYYGINDMDGSDTLISLGLTDRDYTTNIGANLAKERQQSEVSGMLRFPIAPNTRVRISLRFSEFDYDTANNLDSTQNRYLLGVEWQSTEQILLSFDLGSQTKKFDQNSNPDDTEGAWEVDITWSPESFNRLELSASKDFEESITTTNYLTQKTVDLSWSYDWEDYFSTVLSIGSSDDRSFNTNSTTLDTTTYVSLSADYELLSTLSLNAALSRVEVDSDVVNGSSEKNIVTIGLSVVF